MFFFEGVVIPAEAHKVLAGWPWKSCNAQSLEDFMEDLEASLGLEKSAAQEHELSGATNLSPVETYADSVQRGKNLIMRPTSNKYFGVEPDYFFKIMYFFFHNVDVNIS